MFTIFNLIQGLFCIFIVCILININSQNVYISKEIKVLQSIINKMNDNKVIHSVMNKMNNNKHNDNFKNVYKILEINIISIKNMCEIMYTSILNSESFIKNNSTELQHINNDIKDIKNILIQLQYIIHQNSNNQEYFTKIISDDNIENIEKEYDQYITKNGIED